MLNLAQPKMGERLNAKIMKGKLFLIPTIIADNTQHDLLTPQLRAVLPGIRYFLAENVRTSRRYLSSLRLYDNVEQLEFHVLDKDTTQQQAEELLAPLHAGQNVGVISESGCPAVADPGSIAVKLAHKHNIQVVPLVGPSSVLMALMASGLNGQKFCFHGYLPVDGKEAISTIRELEKESRQKNQTQILIETPYRNNAILQHLTRSLGPATFLTVATDITGGAESIKTQSVKQWTSAIPELPKLPTVFLFLAS